MDGNFRVGLYELHAQRHIYPLYVSDGRGGYEFSSTMTFIRKNGSNFCVFAAHAISPRLNKIDQIGYLAVNGEFVPLSAISIDFKICRERDLVACLTVGAFESKNYFDLDVVESSTEFVNDFGWIGFPKKKAVEKIHHTKANKEEIKEFLVDGTEGQKKWTSAEFLLLGVKLEKETEMEVTGLHINENVQYEHEGFKSKGYSLKGMSGGALFKGPKKFNTPPAHLHDLYQFFGIGLEYINNRLIKGASKHSVETLLEEVLIKLGNKSINADS